MTTRPAGCRPGAGHQWGNSASALSTSPWQLADGERTFAYESAFLQQDPTGISVVRSETEETAAEAIASEELGGPVQPNPQFSGSASTEYAQAQSFLTSKTASMSFAPNGLWKELENKGVSMQVLWDAPAILDTNGMNIMPEPPNLDAVEALAAFCNQPKLQAEGDRVAQPAGARRGGGQLGGGREDGRAAKDDGGDGKRGQAGRTVACQRGGQAAEQLVPEEPGGQ